MLLAELFDEIPDAVGSLNEGTKAVWSRRGKQLDRKYKCTSGPRAGSTVLNPYDCGLMPKRKFKLHTKGKKKNG